MKENTILVTFILFLTVLSACDRSGTDIEMQPIRFDVADTKALVTDVSEIKSYGSEMRVRGVYDGQSSDLVILFDNETITSNGSSWSYSPTRYWMPGKTMRFASLWPAGCGCTIDGDLNSRIEMSAFTQDVNASEQTDLLFANPVSASSGSVSFHFRHLLCNIRFEVAMNAPGKTITVSKVVVEDVHASGSLAMTSTDGSTWSDAWDLSSAVSDLTSGTITPAIVLEQYNDGGVYKTIPSDGFIVLPQRVNETSSTMRFTVSVRIEDNVSHERETKDISATLPQYRSIGGELLAGGEWLAGKVIIYRLVVDENSNIIFGKPEVTPWGATQTSGAIVIK